ncbi:MAG TPA: hypothetical protein PKO09_15925 [Anaerolineae bacterium]|nr:hypothetical protein [Anaerolineae bacterium]
MDSGMIGKIEKARRYAEEPERVRFEQFRLQFQGTNGPHTVTYANGTWHCTCRFFSTRGVCSHTMAMERILGIMIPAEVVAPALAGPVPVMA